MRQLNFRQVHLDFHTGQGIGEIAKDFDPKAFVRTLKAAHVNGINLFAKCHHGHLYYDTKRAERHPGLAPGFDLLGQQLEACKQAGIAAPIYLSVLNDEYAAKTHPDWVARTV
ncbi:MAG: beta-galactosidase, partial [Planctomycetes bacterium]|nr:beta-galactosidase [Planctomycetota bacterium]